MDVQPVTREHTLRLEELPFSTDSSNSHLLSNPLDLTHNFTLPAAQPTRTLGARTVYHEAQAALRPLLTNVQTQEQLDTLIEHIGDIRYLLNNLRYDNTTAHQKITNRRTEIAQDHSEQIHDPPVIRNKGRPRSARITGPLEGRPRGGGAKAAKISAREDYDNNGAVHSGQGNRRRRCGMCRQEGHYRSNCPLSQ